MSRAEMFLAWWGNLFAEIFWYAQEAASAFVYYTGAGLELWGDNTLLGFAGVAVISCLCWFRVVWVSSEFTQANLYDAEWTERCAQDEVDPSVTSTFDRFMKSLFYGAYLGLLTAFFGWVILSFILGFFFGPIRA